MTAALIITAAITAGILAGTALACWTFTHTGDTLEDTL